MLIRGRYLAEIRHIKKDKPSAVISAFYESANLVQDFSIDLEVLIWIIKLVSYISASSKIIFSVLAMYYRFEIEIMRKLCNRTISHLLREQELYELSLDILLASVKLVRREKDVDDRVDAIEQDVERLCHIICQIYRINQDCVTVKVGLVDIFYSI